MILSRRRVSTNEFSVPEFSAPRNEHFTVSRASDDGARVAYLQVDADNEPARRVYRRLGFADAYAYHYRIRQPQRAEAGRG